MIKITEYELDDIIFNSFQYYAIKKYKIIDELRKLPKITIEGATQVLKELKIEGNVTTLDRYISASKTKKVLEICREPEKCGNCKEGHYLFSPYCGAEVCSNCDNHKGLAKCYCGWNVRDDVDRAELGMNENSTFDGQFWEVDY